MFAMLHSTVTEILGMVTVCGIGALFLAAGLDILDNRR